ncbi:hypothetical protein Q31b_26730 [Novipirellula aureliae]|uniref:HAMP domain-containing protein n=1 Tax=Novipirellula aureliae TaxID=2527966 RepID=A0A5C6DYD6_9BACT|nr:hypothetical protein [Novipirellula aureliae]TWU41234.1 hypothetical protein Q31b_26730 [Novipirellula aureliae]
MSERKARRSRHLVDREVQGGLLRKIAIHWVIFFVCNAVALVIWIRLFESPDADWNATIRATFQRFFPFFIITMALIPAFVLDTLKLTHRFAGPLLRFRAALADVSAGHSVAPLVFRNNDFWQKLAADFNSVVGRCEGLTAPADCHRDNQSEA